MLLLTALTLMLRVVDVFYLRILGPSSSGLTGYSRSCVRHCFLDNSEGQILVKCQLQQWSFGDIEGRTKVTMA